MVADGQQLNKECDKSHDELKSAKSAYEKACKESDSAQSSLQNTKNDPKAKPKDVESKEKEAQKKKADAQSKEESYKKQVNDTNAFLDKYYTERMPKLLSVIAKISHHIASSLTLQSKQKKEFERTQMIRNHMLEGNFKKYLQGLRDVLPKLQKSSEDLQKAIDSINHETDLNSFVTTHRTGKEIPELYEFEAYQQGAATTKPKRTFFARKESNTNFKKANAKEEGLVFELRVFFFLIVLTLLFT